MDMTKFQSVVDNILQSGNARQKPWSFLPAGFHSVRMILDPSEPQRLHRSVCAHYFKSNITHCPDFLSEHDREHEYPICRLCELAEETKIRGLKRTFKTLMYMYLVATDSQSRYWKPGRLYLVVGGSRLRSNVDTMVATVAREKLDLLYRMITPSESGKLINLTVGEGAQGVVQPQVSQADEYPPLTLPDYYKPLGEMWLPEEFQLSSYLRSVQIIERLLESQEEAAEGTHEEAPEEAPEEVPGEIFEEALEKFSGESKEKPSSSRSSTQEEKSSSVSQETPPGVTLPDGCPGWTQYNVKEMVCVMCDFNLGCRKAQQQLKK